MAMKSRPNADPRAAAVAMIRASLDGENRDEAALRAAGVIMDPPLRAVARALSSETLRRLGQIDAVLASLMERPPRGRNSLATDAMRVAAAEILFLGRDPAPATGAAVAMVKRDRRASRLSGLVNATLRKLIEDGPALVAAQDPARVNAPDWLWRRMTKDMGAAAARTAAEAHMRPAPLDLTPKPGALKDQAALLNAAMTPTGSLRLTNSGPVRELPGYDSGAWWAQDSAAALPVLLLAPKPGERALDIGAAPGGKTMQLAASGAHVTALDVSEGRLERLRANLTRTALEAEIVVGDAFEWTPPAPFDAVLLDAPCSALGTIRRHPELPHVRDDSQIKALTETQDALLDRAWAATAPGGRMVYAVCSFTKAEGPDRAAAFEARHSDAAQMLPRLPGTDGLIRDGRLRIFPGDWADIGGLDGFFIAGWRKAGG